MTQRIPSQSMAIHNQCVHNSEVIESAQCPTEEQMEKLWSTCTQWIFFFLVIKGLCGLQKNESN